MTIKQFIRKYGWQLEYDSKICGAMSVDVDFVNNEGKEDETQFDIRAYDEEELSVLFDDFCRENKFSKNTVTGITVVQMADAMEELL